MSENKIIEKNSEILFLYDARMCNPNGDPDDENKPRMDYTKSVNLVSDVRLKRYIRDYWMDYMGKEVFISKVEDKTVDAKGRLKHLVLNNLESFKSEKGFKDVMPKPDKPQDMKLDKLGNHMPWLLSKLIDVRFFGATMPIKSETGKGSSITFTGPVQFNWGYSLNKVTGPIESNTITSTFAGAKEDFSSMGKDYRLAYSIIAFHGIISATRAKYTQLTENDVSLLDEALIKSIPLEATSRSKLGQHPLLYIRVEYNTAEFFHGDLRPYVKITDVEGNELPFNKTTDLRSPQDYSLDLKILSEKLKANTSKISKVYCWFNSDLKIINWDFDKDKTDIINF